MTLGRAGTVSLSLYIVLALLASCRGGGSGGGEAGLELVSVNFTTNQRVALNHTFRLEFDRAVDLETVNLGSIQFTAVPEANVEGEFPPASGEFFQAEEPEALYFQPRCPLEVGGADGFVADTIYTLTVLGGEEPTGVRGVDRSRLAESIALTFRTEDDKLYYDPVPGPPELANEGDLPGRLPLNLAVNPMDPIELEFDQPLDPATISPASFRLLYQDPDGVEGDIVPVPTEVILTENCNQGGGAVVFLLPRGILPAGSEVAFRMGGAVAGFGENDSIGEDLIFHSARVEAKEFEPQRDAIVEPFEILPGTIPGVGPAFEPGREVLQPLARWGEGVLRPAPLVPEGFVPSEVDIEIGRDTANGKTVTISTDGGVLRDLTGTPVFFPEGVINVRNLTIINGGELIVEGSKPLRLFATGNITIAGKLLVEGQDGQPVESVGIANQPSVGGSGRAGGGKGGDGSPDTTRSSVKGDDGNGPYDVPGAGGKGGHSSGKRSSTDRNDSAGAGGGGGNWGRKELVYEDETWQWVTFCYSKRRCHQVECIRPIPDCPNQNCNGIRGLPNFATQGEPGANGPRCFDDSPPGAILVCNLAPPGTPGNELHRWNVCNWDAITGECQSKGGQPGPTLFFDGDEENNFWGRKPRQGGVIVGELEEPLPGQGGGGGGDNLPTGLGDPNWWKTNFRAGAGGGGGGLADIFAAGTIEITGTLSVAGGNGSTGERYFTENLSISGAGGGGAGGMLLLESRTGIRIGKNAKVWASGGDRGGAGTTLPGWNYGASCYTWGLNNDARGVMGNKVASTGGSGGKGFVVIGVPFDLETPATCRGEFRPMVKPGALQVQKTSGGPFEDVVCEEDFILEELEQMEPKPELIIPRTGTVSGMISPWYYAGQAGAGLQQFFSGADEDGLLDPSLAFSLVHGEGAEVLGEGSVRLVSEDLAGFLAPEPRVLLGDDFVPQGSGHYEIVGVELEGSDRVLVFTSPDSGPLPGSVNAWSIQTRFTRLVTGGQRNFLPEGMSVSLQWEGTGETEKGSMIPVLPPQASLFPDLADPRFEGASFLRFHLIFDIGSEASFLQALPELRSMKIRREF